MQCPTPSRYSVVAAALLFIVLQGCASNPRSPQQASNAIGRDCPAGHTLTCETSTTGRIHHGTFGKDNKRCACVNNDHDPLNSPVIPGIRP